MARLLALLMLCATAGCDLLGPGNEFPPQAQVFEARPSLQLPRAVGLGEAFEVAVRARPVVSGAGSVYLSAAVERLRVESPVRDTVTFEVGASAATRSVPVVFVAGQAVALNWRVVVEDLPEINILNPQLSATIVMDSVRVPDGRLVALDSEEGCAVVAARCVEGVPTEGVASSLWSGGVDVQIRR